jgi:hypothetical protein
MLAYKNLTNKIFRSKNITSHSYNFDDMFESDGYSEIYQKAILKNQLQIEQMNAYRNIILIR